MVRFSRSGGEILAVAVRIGRAASGKNGVAICGYHGWHDWYLSVNLGSNDGLKEHLLPGLSPVGVNKNLEGTTRAFSFNNQDQFDRLFDETDELGVVVMEVSRDVDPDTSF